jgi:hypothetical protein
MAFVGRGMLTWVVFVGRGLITGMAFGGRGLTRGLLSSDVYIQIMKY